MTICSGYVDNGIYFIKPIFNNLIQTEMFKVVEPSLKRIMISSDDNDTYLWHLRLGHINLYRIDKLIKDSSLRELKVGTLLVCESCLEGKMTKRAFSAKGERVRAHLEIIHSDVCGPLNVKARGNYKYFVTFIDNYSRYGYAYLMHKKSEVFEKFKEFYAEVEKQLNSSIKTLQLDR